MTVYQLFKPCIIGALVLLIIFGLVCVYFGLAVQGSNENTEYTPQEGIWYCAELQMQLSFSGQDQSTVIIDGNLVNIACENDIGSHDIYILCQDVDNPSYKPGEMLLWVEYVSLDDSIFVVSNHDTGEVYNFTRIQ